VVVEIEVPSSLSARPEIVNRWITALPERKIDPLHDEVMDFAALFEGGLSQRFVDRFGQVQARMDDIWPWPASSGLHGFAGGGWLGPGVLGHLDPLRLSWASHGYCNMTAL
jgi:hypothetical protein